MNKKIKKPFSYLKMRKLINRSFVAALTVVTVIWIWKLRTFPMLQIRTIVMASLIYLIWAYVYHFFDKSLTVEVYIEYLLTAVLALVLLMGVLV